MAEEQTETNGFALSKTLISKHFPIIKSFIVDFVIVDTDICLLQRWEGVKIIGNLINNCLITSLAQ